jgi:hypothetical protein
MVVAPSSVQRTSKAALSSFFGMIVLFRTPGNRLPCIGTGALLPQEFTPEEPVVGVFRMKLFLNLRLASTLF